MQQGYNVKTIICEFNLKGNKMTMNNSNVFEKLKSIRVFHSTSTMGGENVGDGNFETGNVKVLFSSDPSRHKQWLAYVNSNASAILFPLDDPIQSVFPKTIWDSVQKAYEKYNLANNLDNLGKYADAEILYWESLEIQPTPEAFANLAHIFLSQERYNDATLVCYRGLKTTRVFINDGKIYTDDFDVFGAIYSNLGLALQNLMKLQEAEQALRKSIAINPNIPVVQFNFANVLDNLNRLAESENAYRLAIEIKPNFAQAYFNLGILLAKQKRTHEANSMIGNALRLDPSLQRFLNSKP